MASQPIYSSGYRGHPALRTPRGRHPLHYESDRFSRDQLDAFYQAVATVHLRRDRDAAWRREMADINLRYNGDWAIPLPSVEGEPDFPAIATAIISDSIDSTSQRANDTLPQIFSGSRTGTDLSNRRAADRKRAWYHHWHASAIRLKAARFHRHLKGYGTFAIGVRPDARTGMAMIEVRNPLYAYPDPMADDELRPPHDIGFVYGRSAKEVAAQFPEAASWMLGLDPEMSDTWDVLHWQDQHCEMVGIIGRRHPDSRYQSEAGSSTVWNSVAAGAQGMLVNYAPNKAGECTWVCPRGVTLDRPMSALTRITPIVDLLNKIVALDFVAGEKAVFGDMYAVGNPGETPKIISGGGWQDGRTGKINLLAGVRDVGMLQSTPGPLTQQLMSNLERSARLSAGNPSLFSGEMQPSVRSGQTMNRLAAYSVDPEIAEMHEIAAWALTQVNKAVANVELGWFSTKKYEVFSGWPSDRGALKYQPKEIFGGDEWLEHVVAYPFPGMDAQNATIALAQQVEAGFLSGKTARSKHPGVDDADFEEEQMLLENLQNAEMSAFLGGVQNGTIPFTLISAVKRKVKEGKTLDQAIEEVQKETQEREATQAPEPEDPNMVAPPETMAGMNIPGIGGEMAAPAGPPPGMPAGEAGVDAMMAAMMSGGGGMGGGPPA